MSRRSINILSLTAEEFIRSAEAFSTKAPQARQIYRRVMRDGADDTPEWVDLPGMAISAVQEEDQTRKFTLRMHDGLETESVILPQLGRTGQSRSALCVSSQIGCARGCEFCETAQMGLIRNLAAPPERDLTETALPDGVFLRAVLRSRVIQEQVAFELESGAERPRLLREVTRELFRRLGSRNHPTSSLVHHGFPSSCGSPATNRRAGLFA